MVIRSDDQAAAIPAGNPVAEPIPVAPTVIWVIFVKAVLIQANGEEEAGLTFTVTTADPLLPLPGLPLASLTDTIVYVVLVVGLTDMLAPEV